MTSTRPEQPTDTAPPDGSPGSRPAAGSAPRPAPVDAAATTRQELTDARSMVGLVAVARELGEASTESEVLAVVDRQAVELLGVDAAGLTLRGPDPTAVRNLTRSYSDEVLATLQVLPADHPLPAVRGAVTGVAHFLPDLATAEALFPGSEELYLLTGMQATAVVPLRARGVLLGAFVVARTGAHTWRTAERDLLEAFAALTAQAVDRLRASDAEHAATERARHSADQQAGLVRIAQAFDRVTTEGDVLDVITHQGVALSGAQGAVLCLLDPTAPAAPVLRALASKRVEGWEDGQETLLPADLPLPVVRSALTGEAFYLADRAAAAAAFPGCEDVYAATGTEATATVALRAAGTVIGSLSVAHEHARTWSPEERELLEALALLTGQAVQRISARRAERAAGAAVARFSETLQRSLLTSPPATEQLQIAVRYAPAASEAQVGGDWYDVFKTSSGATCLVIGDVTGHDRHAAAAMGQLRNLLRGIGYTIGRPPAAVLSALDRAAHGLAVGAIASTVLAQVEQSPEQAATGAHGLRWSNAGHPPPLLIDPGGAPRYVEARSDLLIGVDPDTARHDHTAVLTAGSTLLLYTDGLVERRGVHLMQGLDWLLGAVADLAHLDLEELCDALLAEIGERGEDDVALLALRTHPHPAAPATPPTPTA